MADEIEKKTQFHEMGLDNRLLKVKLYDGYGIIKYNMYYVTYAQKTYFAIIVCPQLANCQESYLINIGLATLTKLAV